MKTTFIIKPATIHVLYVTADLDFFAHQEFNFVNCLVYELIIFV